MTDLELLFLVLAVLYLWECTCWVRKGAVGFQTWLGVHWRIAHPGTVLGNARGGFILANPLPPLGTLLLGYQQPVSVSKQGVLAFVSPGVNPGGRPPQSGNWLPWGQVQKIQPGGKKVLINGREFLRTASPGFAAQLAGQLRTLQELNAARREGAIRQLISDSLDTKALENRWNEFQKQTAGLRAVASLLFIYLFVGAPLIIRSFSLQRTWVALLLGILACTCPASFFFRRAHKQLYPKMEDERFTHLLLVLLSPVSAIRACDMLSRPLFEAFHPLALARVFCAKEQFREFARNLLLEMRHPSLPLFPATEPAAAQTEQQSRTLLRSEIEKFIERAGLVPDELLQPPAPTDETCRSYCPRCRAQFTSTSSVTKGFSLNFAIRITSAMTATSANSRSRFP